MKSARSGFSKIAVIIVVVIALLLGLFFIGKIALRTQEGSQVNSEVPLKAYETDTFVFYYPEGSSEGSTKNSVEGRPDYIVAKKIKYGNINLDRLDGKLPIPENDEACKKYIDTSTFDINKDKVLLTKAINTDKFYGCEYKYSLGVSSDTLDNGKSFDEAVHHYKLLQYKNPSIDSRIYKVYAFNFTTAASNDKGGPALLDSLDMAVSKFTLK